MTSDSSQYLSSIPDPPVFGLNPDKFPRWRTGQDHAVESILSEDDKRFLLMVCPTGFGKSLMYIVAAMLYGGRALVLTSTNPLSQQIMTDFGSSSIVQIKGKGNYRCLKLGHGVMCDRGPCNYGLHCGYKESGCDYYDQVRKAASADIVVTNYAYWIYNNKASRGDDPVGIGDFDLIVCDEAHDSPNKVADAFTIRFSTKNKVEEWLLQPYNWRQGDMGGLRKWLVDAKVEAGEILTTAKRDKQTERAFQASNAVRKLTDALNIVMEEDEGNVIVVPEKSKGVLRVAVAWPFDRAQQVLFRDAERVLLTSATVRPKTATMLGVADSDYRLMEYPHIISQDRRLMYHIPCVRMNYRTNPTQLKTWLVKADNIIRSRGDRNGIFHTVSYKRRDMVMKHSGHGHKLMTHNARDAQSQLDAFRSPPYGKVLVSPSMTTGYDFPYDAARYQIIGKIAFPDTSDPITKARCKLDDDYSPYVAMQTLVQTTGRIVRAADDWGETFIIDDNIRWFIHQYAAFAPDWFKGSYRSVRVIPQPPEIE